MEKPVLDPLLVKEIDQLCEQGDREMESGKFREAAQSFINAFRVLPRPKEQWEVTPHLIYFWGLAYFKAQDWDTSINSFTSALFYKSFAARADVHLYLGIAYHNEGKPRNAKRYLANAYRLGGCGVFHEVDDKYLKIAMSSSQPSRKKTKVQKATRTKRTRKRKKQNRRR